MIDIEIFFVADLNGYRLAKVETLLRRNQIYIYIVQRVAIYARQFLPLQIERREHARSRHRPAVRLNRFIDLSINFHSSDSYAWIGPRRIVVRLLYTSDNISPPSPSRRTTRINFSKFTLNIRPIFLLSFRPRMV